MPDNEIIQISRLRFEHAKQCLADAELMIESGSYNSAANRIYYAVFHAMRSVLIIDGFDSKKHSGIISEFQRQYIKTGVFPKETSAIITAAFDIRTNSDYNDFYYADENDVKEQLANAQLFLDMVSKHLDEVFSE